MTMLQTEEVLEMTRSREQALEFHITGRFYPPHPEYVKQSMRDGFKKYWAGEIGLDDLREACYLRDLDGLYRYFGCFLNEEEDLS